MSNKMLNARIMNKRDSEENWSANNPVLLNGEVIIIDIGNNQCRMKVGNGASTYNELPFMDESTSSETGSTSLNYETWTFTLVDGSIVSKQVVIK